MRKAYIFIPFLITASFLLVAAGCQQEESTLPPTSAARLMPVTPTTPARIQTPAPPPSPTISKTAAPPAVTVTTQPPTTEAAVSPSLAPPAATGDLLKIVSPATESVVRTKNITIRGSTSPAAVLTVGDKNVEVDEEGNFSATLNLEEGVNVIEVLASELDGDMASETLVVIYAP